MIRVLLVPSSDYLGHPFPQRYNQIFERIHDGKKFEVHAVRFRVFDEPKLKTNLVLHELGNMGIGHFQYYYLMNMVGHACEIRRIVRQEDIDVVVLSHLAAPFVYTLMDKLSDVQIPVVFDLPDFYPTSAAGYLFELETLRGKLLTGMFDLMLRYMLRHAMIVTTASLALAKYATSAGAHRVVCVPNGISEFFLELSDGQRLRHRLGFDLDDIIVGYIGSIEFWLDMKSFIRGVALAKSKNPSLRLLLVGKGLHTNYLQKVKAMIKREMPVGMTKWLTFVKHEELPEYVAALDMGTMPFNACDPTAYYAAPNKLWEYLSQKIPVIATPIPEVMAHKDLLYLANTPIDYVKSIEKIISGGSEVQEKVERGRQEALQRTWDKSARLLSEIVAEASHR